MAYNNYFPYGYQNPYQVTNQFPTQNQQQPNNSIIWVVGENGADSYLIAPGETVLLWDSTAPVLYLKSADSLGRPTKKIFDYTERGASPQIADIQPQSDFASKADVDYLKEEIASLKAKFEDTKGAKK